MSGATLPPIPWRYVPNDMTGSFWTWETTYFVGTISTEQHGFYWWLGDLVRSTDGTPLTITEGRGNDFASAESSLREALGKSYPAQLGYRGYAGHLATTFELGDGTRVDLAQHEGQRVVVTIENGPGVPATQIIGAARVVNYDLEVDSGAGAVHKIRPIRISRIVNEGGGGAAGAGANSKPDLWTGVGRIYRGGKSLGCSGTPGYLPNTMEHNGPSCAVHENRRGGSNIRQGYA